MAELHKSFNIFVPLQKDLEVSYNDVSGVSEHFLVGVASTVDVDRDTERMSDKALAKMETECMMRGVNLFGNHEHDWENTLGVITEGKKEGNSFKIKVKLDNAATNPKVPMLLNKLDKGISLGLSVGGKVLETRKEFDKVLRREVTVIDNLELYEVSVVGIPSNKYSQISIAKQMAMKESESNIQKSNDSSMSGLEIGLVIEGREHPDFTPEQIKEIVTDHLKEKPNEYSKGKVYNAEHPGNEITGKCALCTGTLKKGVCAYCHTNYK